MVILSVIQYPRIKIMILYLLYDSCIKFSKSENGDITFYILVHTPLFSPVASVFYVLYNKMQEKISFSTK